MTHEQRLAAWRSLGAGLTIGGSLALLLTLAACREPQPFSDPPQATNAAPTLPRAMRLPELPKPQPVIMAVESQRTAAMAAVAAPAMTLTISSNTPLFLAAAAPIQKRGWLSLAWDRSVDPSVVGYRLYYGTNSRQYYASATVSNVVKATLTGLDEGTRYYVAAVAYDALGTESINSNEATAVTPIYVSRTDFCSTIHAYGILGRTNMIQQATNLTEPVIWRTILTWVGTGNAVSVMHTNSTQAWFRVEAR